MKRYNTGDPFPTFRKWYRDDIVAIPGVGPIGPTGPQGPQGIQGEVGPRGDDGLGLPFFSVHLDSFSSSSAGNRHNTYFSSVGNWIINHSLGFTIGTNNLLVYNGNPFKARVRFSATPWASQDNQYLWILFVKNPTATFFDSIAPPNFPPGYIPGSVVKGLARNLTSLLTTYSGEFIVDLTDGDSIRMYQSNVTAGNSHHLRDIRIIVSAIF